MLEQSNFKAGSKVRDWVPHRLSRVWPNNLRCHLLTDPQHFPISPPWASSYYLEPSGDTHPNHRGKSDAFHRVKPPRIPAEPGLPLMCPGLTLLTKLLYIDALLTEATTHNQCVWCAHGTQPICAACTLYTTSLCGMHTVEFYWAIKERKHPFQKTGWACLTNTSTHIFSHFGNLREEK